MLPEIIKEILNSFSSTALVEEDENGLPVDDILESDTNRVCPIDEHRTYGLGIL